MTVPDGRLNPELLTKTCTRCGGIEPLENFYADSRASDGLRSWCKACYRAQTKDWKRLNPDKVRAMVARRDPERKNREAVAASNRRCRERIVRYRQQWRRDNPEKYRAHSLLSKAVRAGKIIKPLICEACPSGRFLEAHHGDYSKPLDVEWLCARCHRRLHRAAA